MAEIHRIGGDRTEMLAEIDKLRAAVVAGTTDGICLVWDTPDGADSVTAGVWNQSAYITELACLQAGAESAWRLAMEAAVSGED